MSSGPGESNVVLADSERKVEREPISSHLAAQRLRLVDVAAALVNETRSAFIAEATYGRAVRVLQEKAPEILETLGAT